MAFWRPSAKVLKRKGRLVIVAASLGAMSLSSCATAVIVDSSTDCGVSTGTTGEGNAPLNMDWLNAVKYNTVGASPLALSMLMGGFIETDGNPRANSGNGGYGIYQIQNPGVTHPDITIPEAENPAYATNYMLPFYRGALASVSSSLWSSDPAKAAMQVAFNAERPAGWPNSNHRYTIAYQSAYTNAIAAMKKVGIPLNFTGGQPIRRVQDVSDTQVTDACTNVGGYSGSVDTGSAMQLAKKILANPKIDLNGFVGVKQDVINASQGKPGTAGVMTSSSILRLIATIGETHSVLITAIQSEGRLHCHGIPKSGCPNDVHYLGDGVDFGSLDGQVSTGGDSGSLEIIAISEKVLTKTGGEFGQSQTRKSTPLPPGFKQFWDFPNHLHVEVPRGTP